MPRRPMMSVRPAGVLVAIAGVTMALSAAAAQQPSVAPLASREVRYSLDSGPLALRGSAGDPAAQPRVVYSQLVSVADAPWVRVHFGQATALAGNTEQTNTTLLRITSLADGAEQYLNADHLRQWAFTSAYFNGSAVRVEIIAFPGVGASRCVIDSVTAGLPTPPGLDTVCGPTDDRALSNDKRQGRLMSVGCTGWMINDGNHTMLTAGHCGPASGIVLQFNVPLSTGGGGTVAPPPEDQYAVDPASVQLISGGIGNDYAYFGVFPNANTGLTPFQAQGGGFYTLAAAAPPPASQVLRITGYGVVSSPVSPTWNQVQKTHTGPFVQMVGTALGYAVDTSGGNSGSPVVDEVADRAIGIHTHAGCTSGGGFNQGTAIQLSALQNALKAPKGVCVWSNDAVAPPIYIGTDASGKLGTLSQTTGKFATVADAGEQFNGLDWDSGAQVFYATAWGNRTLYKVTRAGIKTAIGTMSGLTVNQRIHGLGFDVSTATLYGIDQASGQLFRIDTATAATTAIGPARGGTVGGLAFDPIGKILYGVDDSGGATRLVRISTADGARTVVGPLGPGITDTDGLAYCTSDQFLYTVDNVADRLLRVIPATGLATVVGPTVVAMAGAHGLACAPLTEPPTCYVNCNADSKLDIQDFSCFQNKFSLGDAYADCNADSKLDIQDFTCFQNKFAVGCP